MFFIAFLSRDNELDNVLVVDGRLVASCILVTSCINSGIDITHYGARLGYIHDKAGGLSCPVRYKVGGRHGRHGIRV